MYQTQQIASLIKKSKTRLLQEKLIQRKCLNRKAWEWLRFPIDVSVMATKFDKATLTHPFDPLLTGKIPYFRRYLPPFPDTHPATRHFSRNNRSSLETNAFSGKSLFLNMTDTEIC